MDVRRLVCECGFVAEDHDEAGFVTAVQVHAASAHGFVLDAAEIVHLADVRAEAGQARTPEGGDEAPDDSTQ